MYGFLLKRGDAIVYNLTGAKPGHPFHSPNVPDWALAVDGLDIDTVIGKLTVVDEGSADLVEACRHEQARFKRSRTKLHGSECVVRLVVTP